MTKTDTGQARLQAVGSFPFLWELLRHLSTENTPEVTEVENKEILGNA